MLFLGFTTSLYMESLSAFFALLLTLIGALVVIYAGQYLKHARGVWRFFTYILRNSGRAVLRLASHRRVVYIYPGVHLRV